MHFASNALVISVHTFTHDWNDNGIACVCVQNNDRKLIFINELKMNPDRLIWISGGEWAISWDENWPLNIQYSLENPTY